MNTNDITLTAGGMFFMAFAWISILLLNIYCFYNIFKEKEEKITGIPEVESEIDTIDK